MILYWFLLLLIAIVAYGIGSMSTMVIASNYVFRTSLRALGRGNLWLSNFRRIYGTWGWVRLLLVELVKDSLPILFGSLLLGFKGHADVGRRLRGHVRRPWAAVPAFYDFKGSHATLCLVTLGLWGHAVRRHRHGGGRPRRGARHEISLLGTLIATLIYVAVTVLMVDNDLCTKIMLIAAGLVFFKHIPPSPALPADAKKS